MPYPLPSGILVYRFGERGSGFRSKTGKVLDYYEIKKGLGKKSTSTKELFQDINFPCEDSSIFVKSTVNPPIEWKRPSEIVKNPAFFSGGASRFDVQQGELGNCWFLAAVANLTLNKELFQLVVPGDNGDFEDTEYNGAFHFRFWKFGQWVDVVIDDQLPTRDGRLVFMHSEDSNEFWSALLEKAYAKQHGSYESLVGGNMTEAMEDFTGGVTEICKIVLSQEKSLFQVMSKAFTRSSFMGCSLDSVGGVVEGKGPLGLIRGHAYSITDVQLVEILQDGSSRGETESFPLTRRHRDGQFSSTRYSSSEKAIKKLGSNKRTVQLLRIRNPWGNSSEWEGAWSDSSNEWKLLKSGSSSIEFSDKADGEFWMSYQDFKKHFTNLDICHLNADVIDELENFKEVEGITKINQRKWVSNSFQGAWVKGVTAGGCRNYRDTFHTNPQYVIQLVDPDEDDDDPTCTLIIALMQKFRRKLGQEFLSIGFTVYPLKDNASQTPLSEAFFKRTIAVPSTLKFSNSREVSARFKLNPGSYCIIPSTFERNEEGEFILRVFTETKAEMKENDSDVDVLQNDERNLEDVGTTVDTASGTKTNDEAEKARAFFTQVAGVDLEVDWAELKSVLDSTFRTEFKFGGFTKDVCRSMISMVDYDRSGKLGFDEFQDLWNNIDCWKKVFTRFDTDMNGTISLTELREALTWSGFKVNKRTLQTVLLRYGNKSGELEFDDFIMCGLKLKYLIEVFKSSVPDKGGMKASFTMDDWIEKTLYS